jgi:hypothetical protein
MRATVRPEPDRLITFRHKRKVLRGVEEIWNSVHSAIGSKGEIDEPQERKDVYR